MCSLFCVRKYRKGRFVPLLYSRQHRIGIAPLLNENRRTLSAFPNFIQKPIMCWVVQNLIGWTPSTCTFRYPGITGPYPPNLETRLPLPNRPEYP